MSVKKLTQPSSQTGRERPKRENDLGELSSSTKAGGTE
jgi:hypothetical protein